MRQLLPGRNIVLVGLMGAGKSTVGGLVAKRLGRPFVDTDEVVEREAGSGAVGIWSAHGEQGFRDREAAAIRHVAALRGQVVAVGGGALLDPGNVTQLRSTGDVVWLDADAAELVERLSAAHIREPLLDDVLAQPPGPLRAQALFVRLTALHGLRDPAYRQVSAWRLDTTGCGPHEVAQDLLEWARSRPGLLTAGERGG